MKETPIIFSTPMVKAILEGRKCQTRRIIKIQPSNKNYELMRLIDSTCKEKSKHKGKHYWSSSKELYKSDNKFFKCPYKIGDLLYVKESWCAHQNYDDIKPSDFPETKYLQNGIVYMSNVYKREKSLWMGKTRPSIFMPKRFSRIWLKITGVRVERLQEISEEDCVQEGINLESDHASLCQEYS